MKAVEHLGDNAYPSEIKRYLSGKQERDVAIAQVSVSLNRLLRKGYVKDKYSKPRPIRGGRRRRLFEIRAKGAKAIETTMANFQTLSSPEAVASPP